MSAKMVEDNDGDFVPLFYYKELEAKIDDEKRKYNNLLKENERFSASYKQEVETIINIKEFMQEQIVDMIDALDIDKDELVRMIYGIGDKCRAITIYMEANELTTFKIEV